MSEEQSAEKMPKSWRRWFVQRFVFLGFLLFLGWLFLPLIERKMIFHPFKYPRGEWNPTGLDYEDVYFKAADGTKLHGWYAEPEHPRAQVLYLHGNGGNITGRAELLRKLVEEYELAVFLIDYRGYGRSEGVPTEMGVYADARAARKWLARRARIKTTDVVLMGRSLGGGIAVELARDGARGLILESTFTSVPDVGGTHFPFIPTNAIMRSRFDSLAKIKKYKGPLLQIHGTNDEVVPYELGKRLFEASPSKRKDFVTIEGGTHNFNAPVGTEYWEKFDRFFDELP